MQSLHNIQFTHWGVGTATPSKCGRLMHKAGQWRMNGVCRNAPQQLTLLQKQWESLFCANVNQVAELFSSTPNIPACVTAQQSSMGKECNLRICRIMQNKQYTQHKLDGGGVKIQMVFREKITVKKLLEDWNSEKLAKIGLVGESDWM